MIKLSTSSAFTNAVVEIAMNCDHQLRSDLLELTRENSIKEEIANMIGESEERLVGIQQKLKQGGIQSSNKHKEKGVNTKNLKAFKSRTQNGLNRYSEYKRQPKENLSELQFEFNQHSVYEKQAGDKGQLELKKRLCDISEEYSCVSSDKTFRELDKMPKYNSIFSKLIRSFKVDEVESNFCVSYYDQRTYGDRKTQTLKRRNCISYDLSKICDFLNSPDSCDDLASKRINKMKLLDFLNLSRFYSFKNVQRNENEQERHLSLTSAKIKLDNDSIRNFLPIILSYESNSPSINTENTKMIELTISKLTDVLEIKHYKSVELTPDQYNLVGIYAENKDKSYSEIFKVNDQKWINDNIQFSKFQRVKEYMARNQLFPVLLMYKKQKKTSYYDRFSVNQSVSLSEAPNVDCEYFEFLEDSKEEAKNITFFPEEMRMSIYASKSAPSRLLQKPEKRYENSKIDEIEENDRSHEQRISVCFEEIVAYNYRFDLIQEEVKPKGVCNFFKSLFKRKSCGA